MVMLMIWFINLKMFCSFISDFGKKKGDIYEILLLEIEGVIKVMIYYFVFFIKKIYESMIRMFIL